MERGLLHLDAMEDFPMRLRPAILFAVVASSAPLSGLGCADAETAPDETSADELTSTYNDVRGDLTLGVDSAAIETSSRYVLMRFVPQTAKVRAQVTSTTDDPVVLLLDAQRHVRARSDARVQSTASVEASLPLGREAYVAVRDGKRRRASFVVNVASTSDDPFEPESCDGAPLTADAASAFLKDENSRALARARVAARHRLCPSADHCGAWEPLEAVKLGTRETCTTHFRGLSGGRCDFSAWHELLPFSPDGQLEMTIASSAPWLTFRFDDPELKRVYGAAMQGKIDGESDVTLKLVASPGVAEHPSQARTLDALTLGNAAFEQMQARVTKSCTRATALTKAQTLDGEEQSELVLQFDYALP